MAQSTTMRSRPSARYDVAVIGAGPVGCVTALAFARRGARVLLLEADPRACRRLAGEWLHPPALDVLKTLGVDLTPARPFHGGRGFAVFPDDGSRPIVLPYAAGSFGHSIEHSALVETLREHCSASDFIDYLPYARATRLGDNRVDYQVESGGTHEVTAELLVGAGGRKSIAHAALGIERGAGTYSRMAGVLLEDVELPFEGYGHVCLGGLGPILAYRIDAARVRLQIDVPLSLRLRRDLPAVLYEAYAPALPEALRAPFRAALLQGELLWAANQIRPRVEFGRAGLALVGDAVGHHHPLTAVGMTMGFQDAIALADAPSFASYRRGRILRSRVPEMLAVALYEVFADASDEAVEIRRAVYGLWRDDPAERVRTMRFLGCQETNAALFGSSFLKAVLRAGKGLVRGGLATGRWDHVKEVSTDLADRTRWLVAGALYLQAATPTSAPAEKMQADAAEERFGPALRASSARADVIELPNGGDAASRGKRTPAVALDRGARALIAQQAEDGSWEGEVVWSAMLAAQFVLAHHLMGRPIDPARQRRILLHFERTRLASGAWGLSEWSAPSLFVTTLVYVAARVLGVSPGDPLVVPAREFIRREGAASIPTWGKFWLAMMNLYGWEGVSPVSPAIWGMPRWLPVHPSRYYCHTRAIYLGMATLYGERFTAPRTALTDALRAELYPDGYDAVDFAAARTALRREDLYAPPSAPLRASYRALGWLERVTGKDRRAASLRTLRERIRYELRTTSHTSISPVSGLLNILALHSEDPRDPDVETALERMEGWIWEDEIDGARVTGARSTTWDSSFAMQALAEAAPHIDVREALDRADAFLETQQIRASFPDAGAFDRVDPEGGYCFAGVWHGWPVSDCTAEALLARLASPSPRASKRDIASAAAFILRAQNADGGFGSYEPNRAPFSLEWLNPAEMFGDSMTEASYVECTASCIAALARARPHLERPAIVDEPIARAVARLRAAQYPNGAWPGAWGVRLIYGTMFGIRGLLAGGVAPTDPQIRKACEKLKSHQRADGGWGEAHVAAPSDTYHQEDEAQVIQTAWALSALLEARDPDFHAIERAARFLASSQLSSGEWPRQKPAGVFFHTALLDYTLYKSYFPLLALAHYETRRKERALLLGLPVAETTAVG